MGKRGRRRGKSNVTTTRARAGITEAPAAPPPGAGLLPSQLGKGHDPSLKWRWLVFGFLSATILIGGGLYAASEYKVWPFNEREKPIKGRLLPPEKQKSSDEVFRDLAAQMRKMPAQKKWKIEAWVPVSEDDKFIDRFVTLEREKKGRGLGLLAALPGGDGPVSEEEFERRAANDFLRKPKVRITDVWRGEPDAEGKPRPSARRYVLVTKGSGPTPTLDVFGKNGKIDRAVSATLVNPLIIVEVRGEQIRHLQPLRTEQNRAP